MEAKLEILRGAKPMILPIRLPTTIGRSGTARLKLPAATVSRSHCELYVYENIVAVRDLGSSNGTRVNGHVIAGPTILSPDDELQVGPVAMRVVELVVRSGTPVRELPKSNDAEAVSGDATTASTPTTAEHGISAPLTEPQMSESPGVETPAAETPADEGESGDSVIHYEEREEGSFLGIETGEAASEPIDPAHLCIDSSKPTATVDRNDAALKSFFNNLR